MTPNHSLVDKSIYPMVLSFCNLSVMAAWFARQWGTAWVRPDAVSTQTRAYLEPSLTDGGANITNLPISYQLRILMNGPKLLWHLPWTLFRTYRMCCYCTESLYFKGDLVSSTSHLGIAVATCSMYPIHCVY